MFKRLRILLIVITIVLLSFGIMVAAISTTKNKTVTEGDALKIKSNDALKNTLELEPTTSIQLAGNAFVTDTGKGSTEEITENGLENWTNAQTITSIYFRLGKPGKLNLSLVASLKGSNSSTIKVSVQGKAFTTDLSGSASNVYELGTVDISKAGYVKVDLQGIKKRGSNFGDVSELRISGSATTTDLVYANDRDNFYWSRRGPSVHIGYNTPEDTEYFYNEVTVPLGQDSIGSYYMANGFGQGYFGIQVVSKQERWVLFSVWDPDSAADGTTTLVSKGADVIDNDFGGEGTGGQSHLVYNWIAGNTYKFITRAKPDGKGNTLYSAWFYAPEVNKWHFIATWKRPNTNTYLTGCYSFLENFLDYNGHLTRKVLFGNQWALSKDGEWIPITSGHYTGDATAINKQRLDFAGGIENGKFYLRNGGFFNDFVPIDKMFELPEIGQKPSVDVTTLQ